MEHTDRVYAILDRAEELEFGQAKNALLEEAVRIADEARDIELGYEAREALISALNFSGYPNQVLEHFVWCLARFDERPERYDTFNLLWQYKWVLGSLTGFPEITREQIARSLDDFEERVRRAGYGPHPVLQLRWKCARALGDPTGALRQEYRALRPNALSNCRACDLNSEVAYHAELEADEDALREAGPILSGDLTCACVPHATLASLLLPMLRMNRPEEAARAHRKGYRLIRRNYRNFLDSIGDHLLFLVATDNLPRALRIFERTLPGALATRDPGAQMYFFNASRILLRRVEALGTERVVLRLNSDTPFFSESGVYAPAALRAWFEAGYDRRAREFQRRDGNAGRAQNMDRKLAVLARIQPFSIADVPE